MRFVCPPDGIRPMGKVPKRKRSGNSASVPTLSDEEDSTEAAVASIHRQEISNYWSTRTEDYVPASFEDKENFPILEWWKAA